MSQTYEIVAQERERAGKGVARTLRREGRMPAVVYGGSKEPVKISLDDNEINTQYNKGHMFTSICELEIDGKSQKVLARDIQIHPVTDRVEHVDFLRVTDKTKLAVNVPVHFINEDKCPGLELKGVLNVTRHEIEVFCLAVNIPEAVEVSLEGIEIGQAVKWSNTVPVKGVSPIIDDRDFTIATMIAPKKADEPEDEAEEASAEGDAEAETEEAAAE